MNKPSKIMVIAWTILAVGCVGPKITPAQVERIGPGMKQAELLALLGPPTQTEVMGDGLRSLRWQRIDLALETLTEVVVDGDMVALPPARLQRTSGSLREPVLTDPATVDRYLETRRRTRYLEAHPGLPRGIQDAIRTGRSEPDMTPEEKDAAVGPPKEVDFDPWLWPGTCTQRPDWMSPVWETCCDPWGAFQK